MKRPVGILALFITCGPLSQIAVAQEEQAGQGNQLPAVTSSASLTVSGEGYWHREVYQYGDQPSITPYDSSGNLLADGQYRYEYKIFSGGGSSSPRQQDLLGEGGAESYSGRTKPKATETLSGSFQVQGGQIVSN